MGGTSSIPLEILDQACHFIESPKDLLSVALTSKRLSNVVLPDHIEYRVVRCDLRRENLWTSLISKPSLAARIRCLELEPEDKDSHTGEYASIIPRSVTPEICEFEDADVQKCLALVAEVIRTMPQLTTFSWLMNERPTNEIFTSLHLSCPSISILEVLNYDGYSTSMDTAGLENSPLWQMSNLTRFSLTEDFMDKSSKIYSKYTKLMVEMLINRCPHLEDLQIFQNHASHELPVKPIQLLFKKGRWPNLKRLTVEGVALDYEDSDRFFATHPTLEHLCIRGNIDDLDLSSLTNLKSLDVDWSISPQEIPDNVLENLLSLGIDMPLRVGEDATLHGIELEPAKNLQTLVLRNVEYTPGFLKSLFNYVPNLAVLVLRPESHDLFWEQVYQDLSGFCDAFSVLPNLSHLSYIDPGCWLNDAATSAEEKDDVDIALRAFTPYVPKLARLHVGLDEITHNSNNYLWVRVERGEDNVYQDYTVPKPIYTEKLNMLIWGGCYVGAAKGLLDRTEW